MHYCVIIYLTYAYLGIYSTLNNGQEPKKEIIVYIKEMRDFVEHHILGSLGVEKLVYAI